MTETEPLAPDFRFIFESTPGAMLLVLSTEFTIVAANDVWCTATASNRNEVVGRLLFDVFPDNPDDLDANGVSSVRASLSRVVREKVIDVMPLLKYDIELPGGEYEERFWTITNSPMFDSDGNVVSIMNRADDVTDFIRLKQADEVAAEIIESGREPLESIVLRQTREAAESSREIKVANAELTRLYAEAATTAQKLLRVNHDLEQFAYVVSHDLQAPVRNIAGIAELLRERFKDADLSDEDNHFFDLLDQSTARMLAQIQGLLKMSRLQTSTLTSVQIDLSDATTDSIESLSELITESGATVRTVGHLPTIEADPVQLSLLLQNLIGNGIKYRRMDTPSVVEVSATLDSDNSMVEIVVSDNGIGIDEDNQERIFRMFQRLHAPKDTTYQGTGIGLALAEKIVAIHGGSIWVQSEGKGKGSAFHVRLPVTQDFS